MKNQVIGNVQILQTEKSDGSITGLRECIEHVSFPEKNPIVVEMNQVHGNTIAIVDNTNQFNTKIHETDGLVTNKKQVWLMIKTADCAPVVFYDRKHDVIAALHIGWKGAQAKMIEKALEKMGQVFHAQPSEVHAYIGPTICSRCYVFEERPLQAMEAEWQGYVVAKNDGWHVDVVGFLKERMRVMGIQPDSIIDSRECTCHGEAYFSYFRHKKTRETYGLNACLVQLNQ